MKRYVALLATVFALLGLAIALSQPAAVGQQPAGWGTVKGQIVWGGGDIPKPQAIAAVAGNPNAAACLKNGPLYDETWVINNKNKGVRYTFVWLVPEPFDRTGKAILPIHPKLQAVPKDKVTFDQPCCQFIPHAAAIREGQVVVAKNSAAIAHNVKWGGGLENPGGNVILPPNGSKEIDDLKAQRFPVLMECNIHGWMKARVGVFKHPYFAVTDADGNFEIKLVPEGDCRIMILHDSGWRGGAEGRTGQKITVEKDKTLDLGQLDLKPLE